MRLQLLSSRGILIVSGALWGLGGCGDDGSGTGSGTTVSDPTETVTPTTSQESVDTSAGPGGMTTIDDPTTGVDSTSTPMTETETSSGGPLAFRFNSIELTDPGAGLLASCDNADQVNGLLAPALTNDEDGDGFLDMAFVLDFPELDQSDGASGTLNFANAQCTVPDGADCNLLPGSQIYPSNYTVMANGVCLAPDPANVQPGTGNAGTTMGPCFVTEMVDADVVTSALVLPLSDATIAAQFVGDPAGNLVSGTIQGFLSRTDAENSTVDVLGMMIPLDGLLCAEQMDGDGWWMHMNFTAFPTQWGG